MLRKSLIGTKDNSTYLLSLTVESISVAWLKNADFACCESVQPVCSPFEKTQL